MNHIRWKLLALVVATAMVSSGCASWGNKWGHPGSLTTQRNRAVVHDPYIDNDLGPEIAELRPRDFAKPQSEPNRARAYKDNLQFNSYQP